MAQLTPGYPVLIDLEAADFHGLCALADVAAAAAGQPADVAGTATDLLRDAVKGKLDEGGLKWDPAPESVAQRVAEAARPGNAVQALLKRDTVRRYAGSALLVAVLVLLWGGYVRGWEWTGFRANEQLWEWMHLLLLPVVAGTAPLWLRHREYMSHSRRRLLLIAAAAFAVFVAAGYLVPLKWTGFPGNTLWNWLGLLLLPLAVTCARFLPSTIRSLRRPHRWAVAAVALAWTLTIVGGYAWHWAWTGYPGNTLWDWLQLLLLPLLVPTVLTKAVARWISDKAPGASQTTRRRKPGASGAPGESLATLVRSQEVPARSLAALMGGQDALVGAGPAGPR